MAGRRQRAIHMKVKIPSVNRDTLEPISMKVLVFLFLDEFLAMRM